MNRRYERSRISRSTHREYRRSLDLHVLPRIGQYKLTEITPLLLDQLIHDLEDARLAPGTIRNAISPLRKMLGDAHKLGLIATNPAVDLDLPPLPESIGQELPPEHTTAIRQALIELAPPDPLNPPHTDLQWVCFYDLLLGTGMRPGELRALHWAQMEQEKKLIRVECSYSRNELKRPKTAAGIRSIPIFPSVQQALHQLHARAERWRIHAPEQLVFQTALGNPIHPSNFNRRVWQPALRHAGLTDDQGNTIYRPYDLRHTCISRLVAAGADTKLVQTIAGHANPTTTLTRYTHLTDQRVTTAADAFDTCDTGR